MVQVNVFIVGPIYDGIFRRIVCRDSLISVKFLTSDLMTQAVSSESK